MSTAGASFSFEVVQNASGHGINLRESIRLAILKTQKLQANPTECIIVAILGFIQTIMEADNHKKSSDAAKCADYTQLEGTVLSRVFGIREATSTSSKELCKAVPKGRVYYDDWRVAQCAVLKALGIRPADDEGAAAAAIRSAVASAHLVMYEAIKDAMAPIETITALRVGDTPLAKMCSNYEKDTCLDPNIFEMVASKSTLMPWTLPVVAFFRAAANAQGSTSVANTLLIAFTTLSSSVNRNESVTAHQDRLRKAVNDIEDMNFASVKTFLDTAQAVSTYEKLIDMREAAVQSNDTIKMDVWSKACLAVHVNMNADPRPLTMARLDSIIKEAHMALQAGLQAQTSVNATASLVTAESLSAQLQAQQETHTKEMLALKRTVGFKQDRDRGRGRGTYRGRGRGGYHGGGDEGVHRGASDRGGHRGRGGRGGGRGGANANPRRAEHNQEGCWDCGDPNHYKGDAICRSHAAVQARGKGLTVSFPGGKGGGSKNVQALMAAATDPHSRFSEDDLDYFASRVCCLLSSHSLPDDIYVVPEGTPTMISHPTADTLSASSHKPPSTLSHKSQGAVADSGNDRAVTNDIHHVLRFTGDTVRLSGVHGDAINCAGVIIGFPCVDVDGTQRIISCPDTGSYSEANRHCLLPVSRLMHHGFKFNFRIPLEAQEDGFVRYSDYGGTIKTPDGVTIVMVHQEHTWRLPTFAPPSRPVGASDCRPVGQGVPSAMCLPCDPSEVLTPHYGVNSFCVLNSLPAAEPISNCDKPDSLSGEESAHTISIDDCVRQILLNMPFDQRIVATLQDVTRLLEEQHGVGKLTMIQHRKEIKDCSREQVMRTAEDRYVQPHPGDETHRAYLEDLYAKEAMRLHCAFGHCSDKMLLRCLEKHNIPHCHLRKYIRRLECQACLLMLGHRQYRTKKSTVSNSETLPVASDDLPGNRSNLDKTLSADSADLHDLDDLASNRSNLDMSTLVPTDGTLTISEALFSSLPSDTSITVVSFPTAAELSKERVQLKQSALNSLSGSTADDPGIARLKSVKATLDEYIELSEEYDTMPAEGIATFKQAHVNTWCGQKMSAL